MPKLNLDITNTLIEGRNLRRWWIAEKLDIDRRTLHRWLTGRTENVPSHQLRALSEILGCKPETLIDSETGSSLNSVAQVEAARALLKPGLLEDLMPSHRFAEFEALAQGLTIPGLTQREHAELNQRIAIALLRQSKLNDFPEYAARANEMAIAGGDEHLALRSRMLLSYGEYIQGNVRKCVRMDIENLKHARRLKDPWQIAANLSNLADQFYEFSCFDRSVRLQTKAIRRYEDLSSATSLVFCWLGLAACYLAMDRIPKALDACEKVHAYSHSVNYKRGFADEKRMRALIDVQLSKIETASRSIAEAMDQYAALDIEEAQILADASLVSRKSGSLRDAHDYAQRGITLARQKGHVVGQAKLTLALAEVDLCSGKDISTLPCHQAKNLLWKVGYGEWVKRCHPALS